MKAIKKEKVEIKLTLTLEEAEWLKNLMQNPLYDDVDEDRKTSDMRENFFNTLKITIDPARAQHDSWVYEEACENAT